MMRPHSPPPPKHSSYLMPFLQRPPRAAFTAPRAGRLAARLKAEAVRLRLGLCVVLTVLLRPLPFRMGRLLLMLMLLQQSGLLDAAVGEAAPDQPLLLHLLKWAPEEAAPSSPGSAAGAIRREGSLCSGCCCCSSATSSCWQLRLGRGGACVWLPDWRDGDLTLDGAGGGRGERSSFARAGWLLLLLLGPLGAAGTPEPLGCVQPQSSPAGLFHWRV
ncbi:hypothetical protein SRHO_G00327360 [Serrasalmus rhombeus]